jgi:hypothetical protein
MTGRPVAILMMLTFLVPSVARAQAPKAGVVTTLEGNVTARRVALPAPVSLKFKDDIFLQDTVTTGDSSLARMLLGGKAVVTVRERSVLTITEVPGRSTLELESGKFALAVAREKMRPGEEIRIRTPNAVAGVRGTVVITEVNRQGAQIGAGVPAVVAISGLFLNVSPGSTLTLAGPILQAGNSSTVRGLSSSALLFVGAGGGVSISGLTSAVASFTGGSLGVGTVFSASRDGAFTTNGATTPFLSLNTGTHTLSLTSLGTTAFSISGVNTADEVVDESVTLTVGTDQPLRHGGALLDTTSATANVAYGVIVDKALLDATAPIFDLKSSSNLSVTNTLIGVQNQGKLTALGPVIKLNASTLSAITHAINVSGGSLLNVTGDLLGLANGSTLSVANGALLNVSGNSVVNVSGALINFGGTGGNTVSVTNSLCSTSCATVGGIPVLATNDASILITNPIKNSSLGTLSLSSSQAAAIVADGAGTKVTISGN